MPIAIVAIAEPASVVVPIKPTSSCESPSDSRYAGSSTAMNPSQKPRRPRLARMSHAVVSAPAGSIRLASVDAHRLSGMSIMPAPPVM
ncbi:hypothetical protein [Burkholderia diffusa]|uniref:hypothetical protein n=1 Tax=Burkholderia diffusa TaxID=488732 RepID=UPI001E28A733|nr:hypothetical protein [Burkholderia diffusa]